MIRSMFIPGALHGIEASFLADTGLRKMRTAVFKVVWSRSQPLANIGAVLRLQDGPQGCDPAYCVVWFRFCRLLMLFTLVLMIWVWCVMWVACWMALLVPVLLSS